MDVFIQLSEIFHVSLDFLILGKLDVTQKLECKEQLKAEIVSLIDHLTNSRPIFKVDRVSNGHEDVSIGLQISDESWPTI